MQKNILESLTKFIFKYIWLFCAVLIVLECGSTVFGAIVLMKHTSGSVMSATCGEISSRVNSVLLLMEGLSKDNMVSDTTLPLFDRAVSLFSLQKSYNLYMVAVTDEECNVISADTVTPKEKLTNLMFREYMQTLYRTGEYQITDPIIAGADGKTVNYTIAYPILKEGKVEGTVFGAIYFDEIQEIINRNSNVFGRSFYLFGKEQTVISSSEDYPADTTLHKWSDKSTFFGTNETQVKENIQQKKNGSYWVLKPGGLSYVLYQPVAPANWTLFYQIDFISMILVLLPATIAKVVFYLIICAFISVSGKRFFKKRLTSVNRLLDKMSSLQYQLFQSENADQADYTDLLDLSQKGLVDQLTGLSTRTVLFGKMQTWEYNDSNTGAVIFIDLDNLKHINDTYGHDAGDAAIVSFAAVLKRFETDRNVITARYGGDEFILAIKGYKDDDVTALAEELCLELHGEISINNHTIPINCSIGIALFPKDGTKPEDLICKADLALYHAKHNGKNQYVIYSESDIS